ncbi:hydrogenase subunit MbhD domain-containing protein [Alkalicaulis satelles]|uniref:hydrogenase subunit MbhD domain-containing protein n=1 Tax=Alkalicaulis satelles TaxID=2609175 RepID=UPI0018EB9A97|nr:hydrogenase subunit MbhD domain-containing protein [Alkalicaulis satelles]
MSLAFDLALCAFILGAAALAVAGRNLFGSVVFYIVYGVLIALAWLSLGAVDVALAEAAIGAGVTGVLLIGAWQGMKEAGALEDSQAPPWPVRLWAALGAALTGGLVITAIIALPGQDGLTRTVADEQGALALGNPVTAVLLGFRAYDTLLETLVLSAALAAVWSLSPERVWGGIPGPKHVSRPDGVMASFGRLLPPLGLLVGVYLVWAGADQPGGAFQAGTVLAAVWILIVLSGLRDEPRVSSLPLRAVIIAGPAVFLGAGLAGALAGQALGYPPGYARTAILIIEYALTVSIAATLALLIAGPARRLS